MALPPATPTVQIITFFGTCPTTWANLSADQKESCIGQDQLLRQIEGHFVWPPAGELGKQWIDTGYGEYSAVISHRQQRKVGRRGLGRGKLAAHQLLLLSTSSSRDTAKPYIVVSSKSEKVIKDTIGLFESHRRLCNFGLEYMAHQTGLKLTAGEPEYIEPGEVSHQKRLETQDPSRQNLPYDTHQYQDLVQTPPASTTDDTVTYSSQSAVNVPTLTRQDAGTGQKRYPYVSGLSGARISVHKHSGKVRGEKKNVATIGGVFQIGGRHFALTAAHVFFDNVESTGSWADSGLYVISDSSNSVSSEVPPPKVSEIYEIIIEKGWPQLEGGDAGMANTSLGLVAPSLLQRRKTPATKALPEVIWNAELDWALIELTNPALWEPSKLHLSPNTSLGLKPPSMDQGPPSGRVLLPTGVSGSVTGIGLNTVGGIMLPWSRYGIKAWVLECEIAVGDCGSMAICPQTGTVYGMVVAHDSDTIMTYIVPALPVFQSIIRHFGQSDLSIADIFSSGGKATTSPIVHSKIDTYLLAKKNADGKKVLPPDARPSFRRAAIIQDFLLILRDNTIQSLAGERYIRKESLLQSLRSQSKPGITKVDLLLDYAYSQYNMVPVQPDQLLQAEDPCICVFSILLELDRGHLIDRFQRLGLSDKGLPFDLTQLEHSLARFQLPELSTLAKDFFEKQWAYCPLVFALDMGRDLPLRTVVPILKKQRINAKGGTAKLWQIEVLEEFVDPPLRQVAINARYNDSRDTLGYRYHFALKSFTSDMDELFKSELDAFRAFRENDGMIRCLGDYSQAGSSPLKQVSSDAVRDMSVDDKEAAMVYNILLEYGELDLDEYFALRLPPVLPTEISGFWRSLSSTAHAIADIHHFTKLRGGVQHEYHGWHADIKPDNILVIGNKFKLADPGFARFEKSDKAETLVFGGTVTYGAPESHHTRKALSPVTQAIDIWSFGCVLSEAVTWVILGNSGLRQFQDVRKAAIKNAAMERDDSFHAGGKVLEDVLSWHGYLRVAARRTDTISSLILDLVDQRMLIGIPDRRISARDLCTELEDILHHGQTDPVKALPNSILRVLLETDSHGSWDIPTQIHESVFNEAVTGKHESAGYVSSRYTSKPKSSPPLPSSGPLFSSYDSLPTATPRIPALGNTRNTPGAQAFTRSRRSEDSSPERTTMPNRSTLFPQNRTLKHSSRIKTHLTQDVFQARAEIERQKKGGIFKKPQKDEFLERYIPNRDFMFIVDNAETMREYWDEATFLLETLVMKIRRMDEDGSSLSFTTGPVKVKSARTTSKFTLAMRDKAAIPSPGVHTDMSRTLGPIMFDYLQGLKSKLSRYARGASPRGLTLIILTDGLWEGMLNKEAVEQKIHEFTKELNGTIGSLPTRTVSLEFIQFGNDPDATKRLQRLDLELKYSGTPDIVDTEPSKGNIYKMLLGSFVEEYDYADADPDNDESKLNAADLYKYSSHFI